MKRLAKYIGQDFDALVEAAERDVWLDAFQQKQIGIVDDIIFPDGSDETNEMDGFDAYISKKTKHHFRPIG